MNDIYVVYLTVYSGNRLPPFYIGSTTKSKILSGYNGTVQSKTYKPIWLQERRKNPHFFRTVILSHHETNTEALAREESLQRFFDAPNNPMYINKSLANKKFGLRRDMSGTNNPMFGSTRTFSQEHRLHIGLSMKGKKNRLGKSAKPVMEKRPRKPTTLQLECHLCGTFFTKNRREYARQIKRGRSNFFCSLSCSSKYTHLKTA